MNSELFDALELLEKTKGIPVDYMLEKIEAALVSAFKKEYGSASVRVDINKEKKEVRVFRRRTVVEEVTDPKTEISLEKAQEISRRYELGSVIEDEIKGKNFGRISALTGKQVIVQGIREAEKNNLNREYEKKKEEVISAQVTKRDDSTGGRYRRFGRASPEKRTNPRRRAVRRRQNKSVRHRGRKRQRKRPRRNALPYRSTDD